MKIDIRKYLSLRDSLLKEKSGLEVRLREIDQALGQSGPAAPAAVEALAPTGATRRGRRGRRGLSLRNAVIQVTSGRALTKQEILQRIQTLGYRFATKNPLNSLGVILYGRNPKFRNDNGRFSVTGKPPGGAGAAAIPGRGGARKRRTMSPEARARIAAAQRARWAKTRAGKK